MTGFLEKYYLWLCGGVILLILLLGLWFTPSGLKGDPVAGYSTMAAEWDFGEGLRGGYFGQLEEAIRAQSANVREGERGIQVYLDDEDFDLVEETVEKIMRAHASEIVEEEIDHFCARYEALDGVEVSETMDPEEVRARVTDWIVGKTVEEQKATLSALADVCLHTYQINLYSHSSRWDRSFRWVRTYISGGHAYRIKEKVIGDEKWVEIATKNPEKIEKRIRLLLNLQLHRPVEVNGRFLVEALGVSEPMSPSKGMN